MHAQVNLVLVYLICSYFQFELARIDELVLNSIFSTLYFLSIFKIYCVLNKRSSEPSRDHSSQQPHCRQKRIFSIPAETHSKHTLDRIFSSNYGYRMSSIFYKLFVGISCCFPNKLRTLRDSACGAIDDVYATSGRPCWWKLNKRIVLTSWWALDHGLGQVGYSQLSLSSQLVEDCDQLLECGQGQCLCQGKCQDQGKCQEQGQIMDYEVQTYDYVKILNSEYPIQPRPFQAVVRAY